MRAALLVVLLVGAASAACGDDDGGGGPGGDGGEVGDGGAEADAPVDAAGPRRVADNVIFLERGVRSEIRFSDDTEGPGSCLSEPVAGCEIQTCNPAPVPLPRPHAGLVTASPAGGEPVELSPAADGTYPTSPVTWEDGAEVAVEAAGDQAPAFRVDATGPGDVTTVVAPAFPNPVVRRDQALLVEWTGAESFVAIAIRCPTGEESVQARCPLPEGTTGSVPVAALQRLPACAAANLHVFTEDRQIVEAGPGFTVRVGLRGAIHTATATIQ